MFRTLLDGEEFYTKPTQVADTYFIIKPDVTDNHALHLRPSIQGTIPHQRLYQDKFQLLFPDSWQSQRLNRYVEYLICRLCGLTWSQLGRNSRHCARGSYSTRIRDNYYSIDIKMFSIMLFLLYSMPSHLAVFPDLLHSQHLRYTESFWTTLLFPENLLDAVILS